VLGQPAKHRCPKALGLRCVEDFAEAHPQDAGLGYFSFPDLSVWGVCKNRVNILKDKLPSKLTNSTRFLRYSQ